jgi:hypothetical protein
MGLNCLPGNPCYDAYYHPPVDCNCSPRIIIGNCYTTTTTTTTSSGTTTTTTTAITTTTTTTTIPASNTVFMKFGVL